MKRCPEHALVHTTPSKKAQRRGRLALAGAGRPWHPAIERDVITEPLERKGVGDREHEIGVLKVDARRAEF